MSPLLPKTTPESTAPDLKCTVPDCSKAYKRKTGLTNHMASVHQMLVTSVLSPMTATARTLFGKQVVPGTPGVQGNSRGHVTSPLIVSEPTLQCGECGDDFDDEEQMENHKKEEHDDAVTADINDDDRNDIQVEEEFLGDEDDEKYLYDALDVLTQSVMEPGKETEMRDKLIRYRNIMTNKTKLQDKTSMKLKEAKDEAIKIKEVESKQFKELEKKGKDIEKLTKEVKQLKKQTVELKEESKQKDGIITKLKEALAEESEVEVVEQHVNHNCNACNKNFKTGHDLEKHIEAKHNENTCTYCDKIFNGEQELAKHHKRCVDEGLSSSRCNKCNKTFTNFAMKRHRKKCHEEEAFDCPECGQMHDSAMEVKRHYDSEHKLQPVRNKEVCKHWRRGHCKKGDQCDYSHVGYQKSRESRTTSEPNMKVPACKNGSSCDWMKKGICSYFHRGIGVQRPWTRANRDHDHDQDQGRPSKNQTNPWRQSQRPQHRSEAGSERSNNSSETGSERSHNCPCINSLEDFPNMRVQRQGKQQNHNQSRRRN